MAKKRPEVPDHLPPASELVDTECTHSNALAAALEKAIRAHEGACDDYEVVGVLEYLKRRYMNGDFARPGSLREDADGLV